jgi:hypothetical protein
MSTLGRSRARHERDSGDASGRRLLDGLCKRRCASLAGMGGRLISLRLSHLAIIAHSWAGSRASDLGDGLGERRRALVARVVRLRLGPLLLRRRPVLDGLNLGALCQTALVREALCKKIGGVEDHQQPLGAESSRPS